MTKTDIQMVDLRGQYLRIKDEIDNALLEALAETAYINGDQVSEFARNLETFNSVNHVVTCGNGTDALQIAMMGLSFKPGDEVIVPVFSYVAAAEVIVLLGLVPRFVDVRADTFELDYEQLEFSITDKTVGIVVVHLFGLCSNMEAILNIAEKHRLVVIEDAAQALGAEYIFRNGNRQFAGTLGDVGTTSFFPSKNLGCFGDGGALLTNDESLARRLRMIASHGQRKKYQHELIGVNSRLDTLQAAILNVKIKYLTQYAEARQIAAERYDKAFKDIDEIHIPGRVTYSTHVFNQYTCRIDGGRRDELKTFLHDRGIPTAVYYPIPIHRQEAYNRFCCSKRNFPVAEELCRSVISFPIHTEMTNSIQDQIIEQVINFFAHGNNRHLLCTPHRSYRRRCLDR